jgi:hypothetical protein
LGIRLHIFPINDAKLLTSPPREVRLGYGDCLKGKLGVEERRSKISEWMGTK